MEGKYLTATDYNKFMNAKIKKKNGWCFQSLG